METTLKIPDRKMIEMLALQIKGEPSVRELLQLKIDKFNLPYRIQMQPDGSGIIENIFSAGEEYLNRFITNSLSMLAMKERAKKMALCEYPVLITGETGTGKELIAKSMIGNRGGLIQAINCAGFPSELIESELFGHIKGAFTGAVSDKAGLIESAKDGVCFLDEIGEMPMPAQAKLLRVLQEKKIRRVGSNVSIEVNCKFVFATNRDIREMCKAGLFRLDLYARMSTLELHILPLDERMEDCEYIIRSMPNGNKFWEHYGERLLRKELDLSLNVRSLERLVIRFNILGEI